VIFLNADHFTLLVYTNFQLTHHKAIITSNTMAVLFSGITQCASAKCR